MKIPFTPYDFFAYLTSGTTVFLAFDQTIGMRWSSLLHNDPSLALAVLVLGAGYILGHLVAEIAALILEDLVVVRVLGRPFDLLLQRVKSKTRRCRRSRTDQTDYVARCRVGSADRATDTGWHALSLRRAW